MKNFREVEKNKMISQTLRRMEIVVIQLNMNEYHIRIGNVVYFQIGLPIIYWNNNKFLKLNFACIHSIRKKKKNG